jgi:hypothetical protein
MIFFFWDCWFYPYAEAQWWFYPSFSNLVILPLLFFCLKQPFAPGLDVVRCSWTKQITKRERKHLQDTKRPKYPSLLQSLPSILWSILPLNICPSPFHAHEWLSDDGRQIEHGRKSRTNRGKEVEIEVEAEIQGERQKLEQWRQKSRRRRKSGPSSSRTPAAEPAAPTKAGARPSSSMLVVWTETNLHHPASRTRASVSGLLTATRARYPLRADSLLAYPPASQQYFSLRTNQPPATSQQYFSLRTNQHQPSATSQTNRPGGCAAGQDPRGIVRTTPPDGSPVAPLGAPSSSSRGPRGQHRVAPLGCWVREEGGPGCGGAL